MYSSYSHVCSRSLSAVNHAIQPPCHRPFTPTVLLYFLPFIILFHPCCIRTRPPKLPSNRFALTTQPTPSSSLSCSPMCLLNPRKHRCDLQECLVPFSKSTYQVLSLATYTSSPNGFSSVCIIFIASDKGTEESTWLCLAENGGEIQRTTVHTCTSSGGKND